MLDIVPLNLSTFAEGFVNYDNTVKSWEMRIFSDNGICANITSGLPVLAATDVINFKIISLYSNGLQSYYGLDDNTPKLRVHDVLDFTPGMFYVGPDYINVQGEFNLDIPNCKNNVDQKDEFFSELQYVKSGNSLTFKHKPFSFSLFAKGVTLEFPETDEQSITSGTFLARGTVKEDPLFKFKVRLLKTNQGTEVLVDPLGQSWNFSGGNSLKNVTGKMDVINNNTDWEYFKYEGDVTESVFAGASGRMKFTVLGDIKVDDSGISLKGMDTPFGIGQMSYDVNEKALIGSLDISQSYGPVSISGSAQARFDHFGWFFVGGGTLTLPGPISELQAGILFADYDAANSSEVKDKFAQYTYNGEMPEIFSKKIKGFYFGGYAKLHPPALPEIDLNLIVASAYLEASYGGNFGFGAAFGDNGKAYQIDAKAFVSLELGFDLDLIVYGINTSSYGIGYAFGSGNYDTATGNYGITGGGGIGLGGSVHIWTIACLSECDIVNKSVNKNYEIGVKINNPGGIDFYLN